MVGESKPEQLSFDTVVIAAPEARARELLRAINELVSFEFVRELAGPYFAQGGRPSIDPVLLIKMMLVGYLFGIQSERRLALHRGAQRLRHALRAALTNILTIPTPHHNQSQPAPNRGF